MILQALYQLAQSEGLMADPDFEPKPVAWLVRVSREGQLLGIEGTHHIPAEEEGKKKPRPFPKVFDVPREGGRTSGDRAFFLCDKAEYALGIDPEKDVKKRRPAEKLANRFSLFRERVSQCLEVTQDEGIQAIHAFLEDVAADRQTVPLPAECASNDLFSFVFAPDLDLLVTERERVRSYWKSLRSQAPEGMGDTHCIVSGKLCVPEDLFPPVKRVPGGTTSGVALVSFNAGAFESYGWKGNQNAPISRDASEACATALNRLLHPAYHQGEHTLPRRNLRLSADTAVCFWSAQKREDDFASAFAGLLAADPNEVKDVYRAICR
ncbi:MAG: type I-C CRISPR-associated protein Cas8c/Csd1, partial [Candidatus Latescibacteria bacterium]|nr:type I-C CRISPR-associated protein Cas8c/Csd1 [Candidatus Latescibacterota bacterium]